MHYISGNANVLLALRITMRVRCPSTSMSDFHENINGISSSSRTTIFLQELAHGGLYCSYSDECKEEYTEEAKSEYGLPEKRLWAAALLQAFTKSKTEVFSKHRKPSRPGTGPYLPSRLLGEDVSWVLSPNTGIGSFLWICETLNIDSQKTRRDGLEILARIV